MTDVTHFWFLARAVTPTAMLAFFFPVSLEEEQPAMYSAVIAGMDPRIAASGPTGHAAVEHAIEVFKDTIDNACATGIPPALVIGATLEARLLPLPIQDADAIHRLLDAIVVSICPRMGWVSQWRDAVVDGAWRGFELIVKESV